MQRRLSLMPRGSVRTKFTLVLLLVALVPMGLLTYRNYRDSRQALLTSTTSQLVGHAGLQANSIDSFLDDRLASAELLADLPGIGAYLEQPAGSRSGATDAAFAATNSVATAKGSAAYFLDSTGAPALTTDVGLDNQKFANQSYFQEAIKGQDSIQSPTVSTESTQYSLFFAAPVRNGTGTIVGVAVLRVPASQLQQLLQTDANVLAPGSYGVLLDSYGIRVANGADPAANNAAIAPLKAADQQALVAQQQRFGVNDAGAAIAPNVAAAPQVAQLMHALNAPGAAGHAAINPGVGTSATVEAAAVRLRSTDWTYVEVVPQAAFLAAPTSELRAALIWFAAIALAVILLSILLARQFTAPLGAITRYLHRVREGDYQSRLTEQSGDEFGLLAEDINVTVDRLTNLLHTSEQKDAMQVQIEKLLDEVSAVADGDLRVEAEVTAGTLGSVADSFNYMIEELRRIIGTVQASTFEVSTSAMHLRQSSELLAAGSAQQSVRIAETTQAVRTMDESIQHVAENAGISRQVAEDAFANAQRGGEAVAKTIASMNRIRTNVQETAKKVKQLGESSQEIGDIVKLIEDIADKTDLLALNAAIQAELAGEHGRGFAVLADEVRRLAERATASTKQIATLVKSIQSETQEAVMAMEESTREVVSGSQLADEAGQALLSIDRIMAQLTDRIASISDATAEQATASKQIAETMRDISEVTTQTNASTRDAAEKVGYLDQVATQLRTSVAAFRLPESQSA
jgi:methyl-accepting chemotaxis protein